MDVQLTTLDLYANGFQQMLPVLLDAYTKAKSNNLLDDELNLVQEQALETLPTDLHDVIGSIRALAN
ncbi:MAG: hypothetical protein Q7V63_02420 [Gammaproteobacteria bacterium]|nr:hypothetical protein [Gammaproteobacteria bacterium]